MNVRINKIKKTTIKNIITDFCKDKLSKNCILDFYKICSEYQYNNGAPARI